MKHAIAVADLVIKHGVSPKLKPDIIKLAMQTIPLYDPAIMANFSTQSSPEERGNVLRAFRARIAIKDMAQQLGIIPDYYSELESNGVLPRKGPLRDQGFRSKTLAAIAGILIPDNAENCHAMRARLARVIDTPVPGEAVSPENRSTPTNSPPSL